MDVVTARHGRAGARLRSTASAWRTRSSASGCGCSARASRRWRASWRPLERIYQQTLQDLAALRFDLPTAPGATCRPRACRGSWPPSAATASSRASRRCRSCRSWPRPTLVTLGADAGHRRRRLPGRRTRQDPARAAVRRADGVRGASALAVLRRGGRDAAVARSCSTSTSAGRDATTSSTPWRPRPEPRCGGSTSTATATATATSSTRRATPRPGWTTSAGGTPPSRSSPPTASWPRSRGRPVSCRATCTTPRPRGPARSRSLGRRRARRPARAGGGRR